jgi:hypothetical protein
MKRLAVSLLLLLCACSSGPAPEPRTPLPAPPPAGEPADFIGKSGRQLQTVLGVPAFTRKETGSEMWRYDTRQCRVFFFLYPTGTGISVRHVETVPHAKGVAADAACLNVLLGKPASPVS